MQDTAPVDAETIADTENPPRLGDWTIGRQAISGRSTASHLKDLVRLETSESRRSLSLAASVADSGQETNETHQ